MHGTSYVIGRRMYCKGCKKIFLTTDPRLMKRYAEHERYERHMCGCGLRARVLSRAASACLRQAAWRCKLCNRGSSYPPVPVPQAPPQPPAPVAAVAAATAVAGVAVVAESARDRENRRRREYRKTAAHRERRNAKRRKKAHEPGYRGKYRPRQPSS